MNKSSISNHYIY